MRVNEVIMGVDLTPSRIESARQELKPILVLLQAARAASLQNNVPLTRTEIQRAFAKYETILPILNTALERTHPLL